MSDNYNYRNNNRHILIVDDNSMFLRNLKSFLDSSFTVSVAVSGKQAIHALSLQKPALIILDYEMPEMNGKELFETIHNNTNYSKIPIIFLTGVDSRTRVMEILRMKPAGYFLKPIDYNALIVKINQIFEN